MRLPVRHADCEVLHLTLTPHKTSQMYCKTETKKEAEQELLSDPHAPNKFRVLGTLSQFKPFANAFYCPAGSPMAPLSHCELWHMN